MGENTVLITGSTGFIGFRILLETLEAGYNVKAVLRSSEKQTHLLKHLDIQSYQDQGKLSFTIVPDFSAEGAWNNAFRGINFIIHTASPLPLPYLDPEKDIFQPNVQATTNLLRSALSVPTLKRIVLTSSIVATTPLPRQNKGPYNAKTRFTAPSGPFMNVYEAYQASKMHILDFTSQLIKDSSPRFDIINIFPGYTFGRNNNATRAKEMFVSSDALLLFLLKGRVFEAPRAASVAHLDDVAKVHVKALDPSIQGNYDYGVSRPCVYNDAIEIVRSRFPDQFRDGVFSISGNQPSEVVDWDASETEKVFNMKLKSFEEMINDVVMQYLELLEKEENST